MNGRLLGKRILAKERRIFLVERVRADRALSLRMFSAYNPPGGPV
jgi:hypothetical protein